MPPVTFDRGLRAPVGTPVTTQPVLVRSVAAPDGHLFTKVNEHSVGSSRPAPPGMKWTTATHCSSTISSRVRRITKAISVRDAKQSLKILSPTVVEPVDAAGRCDLEFVDAPPEALVEGPDVSGLSPAGHSRDVQGP